jgi:hypothetical protein
LGNLGALVPLITPYALVKKAAKVETLTPLITANGLKRMKISYGPLRLRAANSIKWDGNTFS